MPSNWRELLADLAFVFKWPPSELSRLTVRQMLAWHDQAMRYGGQHG